MKCSRIACAKTRKEAFILPFERLEKDLSRCNNCFFSMEPERRYNEKEPVYQTRNRLGAAYALAYFKKG